MLVKTEGPPSANIMILGESPGKEEHECGRPFVGNAGQMLDRLLASAGIQRSECLVTYVAREKPPGNDIKYYFKDKNCMFPNEQLQAWITQLKLEIDTYQPNIVITCGRAALWALTGLNGIKAHRGFLGDFTTPQGRKVKILPIYNPQAVSYDWSLQYCTVMDLKKALHYSQDAIMSKDNRVFIENATPQQWINYCEKMLETGEVLAFDIETSQPGSHINRYGLAHSKDFGISIPLVKSRHAMFSERDETMVLDATAQVLNQNPILMHNAPFDTGVMWRNYKIPIKNILMDTQIAAHTLYVELPKSLSFLSSVFLDVPAWKGSSASAPGKYNASDCTNTYGLFEFFDVEISKKGLRSVFNYQMKQIEPVIYMMLKGLKLDIAVKDTILAKERAKQVNAENKMREIIGKDVNYNSPQQMAALLYVELGLPIQYKRRKSKEEERKITTDAEAINKLTIKPGHPFLEHYQIAKKSSKAISSFIDVNTSKDGRVFTSYNITGTTSGRWSSSKSIIDPYGPGNFQNQPQSVRKLYRAPSGYVFIQADYVQAEAVAVAYYCKDRTLMNMFKESFSMAPSDRKKKHDVHKFTAAVMFDEPMDTIDAEKRRVGKTLRHACNYSAGPGVVSNALGIGLKDASQLLKIYFERNPFLKIWHKRIDAEIRASKVLSNPFGRIRRFLGRDGDELNRSAYSYKPQSCIGDMMGIALPNFYFEYGDNWDITLQLHDAMYVIAPEKDAHEIMQCMRKCMIFPVEIEREMMYVDVDFKIGPSWGDMEDQDIDWRAFDATFIKRD